LLAYVLITVTVGTIDTVLDGLKHIPAVTEAHPVYGAYDIVARVTAESGHQLRELIVGTIRRLAYLRSTQTLIVLPNQDDVP
jgi:DNA-binding Lrp family transcriptional regulator